MHFYLIQIYQYYTFTCDIHYIKSQFRDCVMLPVTPIHHNDIICSERTEGCQYSLTFVSHISMVAELNDVQSNKAYE